MLLKTMVVSDDQNPKPTVGWLPCIKLLFKLHTKILSGSCAWVGGRLTIIRSVSVFNPQLTEFTVQTNTLLPKVKLLTEV